MYIGRLNDGTIYGLWTVQQWDGQEWLPENHPDINRIYTVAQAIEKRIKEVSVLQNSKVYSNIDATFPNGIKTIQFRNDLDWMNFLTSVTEAYSLPAGVEVSYRTIDNVNQLLTANQLVTIGKYVDSIKKTILTQGWAHDDAIRALANTQGTEESKIAAILAYDISIGW
jgi:hypothetical protein